MGNYYFGSMLQKLGFINQFLCISGIFASRCIHVMLGVFLLEWPPKKVAPGVCHQRWLFLTYQNSWLQCIIPDLGNNFAFSDKSEGLLI